MVTDRAKFAKQQSVVSGFSSIYGVVNGTSMSFFCNHEPFGHSQSILSPAIVTKMASITPLASLTIKTVMLDCSDRAFHKSCSTL